MAFKLIACIHSFGGIIRFSANNNPTVYPSLLRNNGSCYHYFYGILLWLAYIMATVSPLSFYKVDLCSHSFGIGFSREAKYIATV